MSPAIYVRDCMSTELVLLRPDMELLHAVRVLSQHQLSGAAVVDEAGALVGLLTERDCIGAALNAAYHSEYNATVADYMTSELQVMAPDDQLVDVARRFHTQRYLRYPVLDGGRLVGMISRGEVMRALSEYWPWTP